MKKILLAMPLVTSFLVTEAQTDNANFPEPEFSNEVYLYRKDSAQKLLRLEKGSSKMDTKTKLGGMGGSETSYSIDGEKSTVRFPGGKGLVFIFSNGSSSSSQKNSPQMDSMMKANGMDPSMMKNGYGMDPTNMITLYSVETDKENRKIYMMKTGSALPFASKKPKSSEKYSFSVKKIRDGYWELVVDKPLPKGEYAFTVMGMGMANMDGTTNIFAFAVE